MDEAALLIMLPISLVYCCVIAWSACCAPPREDPVEFPWMHWGDVPLRGNDVRVQPEDGYQIV